MYLLSRSSFFCLIIIWSICARYSSPGGQFGIGAGIWTWTAACCKITCCTEKSTQIYITIFTNCFEKLTISSLSLSSFILATNKYTRYKYIYMYLVQKQYTVYYRVFTTVLMLLQLFNIFNYIARYLHQLYR